ncbi:hypothetical protein LTR48_006829 [Friedmanniomyces endolithicus]|uniref:Lipoxygenase domain-containing protein n=1 Tax=Rachicladosporium monterosium TaxID=1507873 RepID=A0ABR0L847_9PEZI|nr:hypothetical protein LTR48_006829 [Friedmanniomyces endolithicus]KAK5144939.1 hypothetical protein LTR32_003223 [Rachicladosporium monterosium]
MSRRPKLSRLDHAARASVEETLSQRADGMPISVKAALHALPKGFDETYERMLNKIDQGDRQYALTLLFPSWTVTPTCIEASSSLESHAITAFKPLP